MRLQDLPYAQTLRFLTEGPSQHHAFAFGGLELTEEELFDDAEAAPAPNQTSTHIRNESDLRTKADR